MKSPLVTVFMPMYNSEAYIREALESMLNQTYSHLEIIIVDDGSTDSSVGIVNSYQDSRIRLIRNKENKGIPYTRNVGLQEATGKYMAIMDADDISLPHRIERQVEFMEKNEGIDATGSFYEIFGGRFKRQFKPKNIAPEEMKIALLFTNYIGNPTAFIRLETLKQHNLRYNLDCFVAQDYEMWAQISKVGNLTIMPEVLLKYRTGHTNITKKSSIDRVMRRKKVIDSIHQDLIDYYGFNLTEEELKAFNEFFSDIPQTKISDDTLRIIPDVLLKLVQQNRENGQFNEGLLLKIIHDSVMFSLGNHKVDLFNQLRIYKNVCKVRSITSVPKEMSYIVSKHLYKSIGR
jgi:glycosyltransferase involved in cell wall biosynthesis